MAVVLFHTHPLGQHSPTWAKLLAAPVTYGFAGVYLFFVLSGFCIHLRFARCKATGQPANLSPGEFWKRRLRRLWPPYVIAMAAYIGLELQNGQLHWGPSLAANIGIHLAMLHNLDTRTAYAFCGVFWTLALEEQLYAAYFLLLRWRNAWGWAGTLGVCFGLRCVWLMLTPIVRARHQTFPALEFFVPHWGTWALGALSVEWALGTTKLPPWSRSPGLAASCLAVGCLCYELNLAIVNNWLVYPVWVIGFWIMLNAGVAWERRQPALTRWVRVLAMLGVISYSLYLTHMLVLGFLGPLLPLPSLLLVPGCILLAWGYYRLVEQRFLSKP